MLLPASALLALLALGAAGPARPRRSSPPFEPFLADPLYMGDEFAPRAADPPPGFPPSAYSWVKAALAHAEALTKQAEELAESLLKGQLPGWPGWPGRRAEEDAPQAEDAAEAEAKAKAEEEAAKAEKARQDEERAKEEAAKVAAMQAEIREQQLQMQARIKEAQDDIQKRLAEATQGLSHLFRFRRAAPWGALGHGRPALHATHAAMLPSLRQMDELVRIKNGAPLHTVRLPGFPAHLFQPGGGVELPGFLAGFDLGQQS